MQWGLRTVIAIGILTFPIAVQQGADARLPDEAALQATNTTAMASLGHDEFLGRQVFLSRWTAAEQDIAALQYRSPFAIPSLLSSLGNSEDEADIWARPKPETRVAPKATVEPKLVRPEPKVRIVELEFDRPALAPLAHTVFCLKYPADCEVPKVVVRDSPLKLTSKRWRELEQVNANVNRSIVPQPNTRGLAAEKWLIAPRAGECHDYAVTKRHQLIALGWPARDLLLSEVIVSTGEHHLVLLVRTDAGDFVADNLTPDIRVWYKTPYQWLRVQTSSNPMIWSTVSGRPVWVARSSVSAHAQS